MKRHRITILPADNPKEIKLGWAIYENPSKLLILWLRIRSRIRSIFKGDE